MALRQKIHPDVLQYIDALAGNNIDKKAEIISDLNDLAVDPEPSRDGWRTTSSRVEFLFKQGVDVRRLTLKTTLPGHRFFYLHDPRHDFVYVMEAVERNAKTYDKIDEPHIKRVKAKHADYHGRELWRN